MRHVSTIALCAALAAGAVLPVFGEPRTGLDVMRLVDAKKEAADSKQAISMVLTDKKGKTRQRSVVSYSRKDAEADRSVMVFSAPADVKNVAFLSYDYAAPHKDDDRWLYLPALKNVRRISGSSGNDYFMGTDFTYDDLGGRDLEDFDYELRGEETIGGFPCWVVESTPKDPEYGYSKIVQRVRKDALTAVSADFYDRQGAPLKRLTVSRLEEVDGYWTVLAMEMEHLRNGHKTALEISEVAFDTGLAESLFRVTTLERGMLR